MSGPHFDLAIIGSGPAGQKAAIAAAKLGKRAVIIDGRDLLGGVCLTTGTIPSKTLREAVLYLTGLRQRAFYGADYRAQTRISRHDLMRRVEHVVTHQQAVVHDQLQRNGVEFCEGMARFRDAHTLEIDDSSHDVPIEAEFILVACGTRAARRDDIPFDHPGIIDADRLYDDVEDDQLARSTIVVGGGVIGMEYAAMGAALEMKVTVIEAQEQILGFLDRQMVEALTEILERHGVTFRLGEKVASVSTADDEVHVSLESGSTLSAERLLYAVGRQGNTDTLCLEKIGLPADRRGRLEVNTHFQTAIPHIYAAGDVIGFPSLASTSMEQGRLAACHMFGATCDHRPELLPYGVYTIPEISMVGRTEAQLKTEGVPYEAGLSRFEELAKAQIIGARFGMLKLLFNTETLELLGVHIIGDGASELVHIGQCVMAAGGTIETIRDTVFNYPTLAEAYKVAALNGLNKLPSSH